MNKNNILSNAFLWLFIGLLTCFCISYVSTLSTDIFYAIYGGFHGYAYIIFLILELVVAFSLNLFIRKLHPIVAKVLYLLYCALTGLSLTGIFLVYTGSSLCFVFLVTAILFGVFALIGKFTNIDLSKYGIYLFIALIAIIILEIVNIFVLSNTLDMILSIITIIVFCFYIAYDINHALNNSFLDDTENKGIYIAFQLFIDFINIFIELLRLFGRSRD
jgi:FtsH-binding integral membrane protein